MIVIPGTDGIGPWYTLAEAAQKTGMLESDLMYQMEAGEIIPMLYSASRRFMACSPCDSDGSIEGYGVFTYRGVLRVEPEGINQLLCQGKSDFRGITMRICQPNNISGWQCDYPYDQSITDHPFVTQWHTNTDRREGGLFCIPLPIEKPYLDKAVLSVLGQLPREHCTETFKTDLARALQSYEYDMTVNGCFSLDDLRLPTSEFDPKSRLSRWIEAINLNSSVGRIPTSHWQHKIQPEQTLVLTA